MNFVNNIENIDELKIWRILEELDYFFMTPEGLTKVDFSTFLQKQEAELVKGRRISREWVDPDSPTSVLIKVLYHDIFDENGLFIRIDKEFQYLKTDESIGISITKPYKIGFRTCEYELEKRRRIQLSDLKSRAKRWGFGQYIDILFTYFKEQITDYYETGSSMFSEALTATYTMDLSGLPAQEATAIGTIQAILASVIGTDDTSTYDGIQYEIT